MKWADALIMMYDVTNLQSFQAVKMLIAAIVEIGKPSNSVALVGNKTDLVHFRQVIILLFTDV